MKLSLPPLPRRGAGGALSRGLPWAREGSATSTGKTASDRRLGRIPGGGAPAPRHYTHTRCDQRPRVRARARPLAGGPPDRPPALRARPAARARLRGAGGAHDRPRPAPRPPPHRAAPLRRDRPPQRRLLALGYAGVLLVERRSHAAGATWGAPSSSPRSPSTRRSTARRWRSPSRRRCARRGDAAPRLGHRAAPPAGGALRRAGRRPDDEPPGPRVRARHALCRDGRGRALRARESRRACRTGRCTAWSRSGSARWFGSSPTATGPGPRRAARA